MLIDCAENKEKILLEFLKICAFDGWNKESLIKAFQACKIDEVFYSLVFPNDCLDLASFYIDYQNTKSIAVLKNIEDFSAQKIRDKIRFSLYARFLVEKENKLALQRLLNFYIDCKNFTSVGRGIKPISQGLKSCYDIADFIWFNIGDQSTDFNFYTKRFTLGKIIFRSLFVFLKDDSLDLQKTKKFIDNEIEKVMNFAKRKAQIKKFTENFTKTFGDFIFDDKGCLKPSRKIIKSLPFFRLINIK
jgi:ubiquinone biosynthesis protein COQ9